MSSDVAMWSAIVVVHLKNGLGIGSRWFTAKSSRVSGSSTWSLRFFVWGLSQAEPAADTLPCVWSTKSENCSEAKMRKVSAKSCRCWNHLGGSANCPTKDYRDLFWIVGGISVAFAIPSWGFECVIKSIWSCCLSRQQQIEAFVQETETEKYIFGGNSN